MISFPWIPIVASWPAPIGITPAARAIDLPGKGSQPFLAIRDAMELITRITLAGASAYDGHIGGHVPGP